MCIRNILFDSWDNYLQLSDYSKKLLLKCCGSRVIDLLLYFPYSILERTEDLQRVLDFNMKSGDDVGRLPFFNVIVDVIDYEVPIIKSRPIKIICDSKFGRIDIVYFNWKLGYIKKILPIGKKVAVSGNVQRIGNYLQMTHPDKVGSPEVMKYWNGVEPIYSTIGNLSSSFIALQIKKLLALVKDMDIGEWIPKGVLDKFKWESFIKSIYRIHNPVCLDDLSEFSKARERIAFDELLANQVCLNNIRNKIKSIDGLVFRKDNDFLEKVDLPFELTEDQVRVLEDIYNDLSSNRPMNRLVQGDVGSGKTVVAFSAALNVVAGGGQVAFIAPTEVLARQHYEKIKVLADKFGINIELVIAKNRKYRDSQVRCLEHGLIKIVIGTHALLEDNIRFLNLGLVIIDEQQRFGVMQRLKLIEKGNHVNALYLSATPIPRTLVLSLFGDLDVSVIRNKPKYRQPIETVIISSKRIGEVIGKIKSYDKQVYWICPLIEESDTKKMADVTSRFNFLKGEIGSVGLLHGKLKSEEKMKVLDDFRDNKFKVLVSTTVIEVGIDVPNANIIVIENAENFGLSQLHQLRGRVGRGNERSFCVLLYGSSISKAGIERLSILKSTSDGFELSEADMKMRGYGNILGIEQSGFQSFRFCDIVRHQDLLLCARDIACGDIENIDLLLGIYGKKENLILM